MIACHAFILLDGKYDQKLMKYEFCELLGIQLRQLSFTQLSQLDT